MQTELWEIDKQDTDEYVLRLHDPNDWYKTVVKRDGCVDFMQSFNNPLSSARSQDIDYIHICNLDDFIKRLQEIQKKAVAHFGEHWGD